jgi:hypothetical protein
VEQVLLVEEHNDVGAAVGVGHVLPQEPPRRAKL